MKISIEDLKKKKYMDGWTYLKIKEAEILQEEGTDKIKIKKNGKHLTYSKGKGWLPATLSQKWEEILWSRALMIYRKEGLDGYDNKDRPCILELPLAIILVRCSTIPYGNKPDNEDIIAVILEDGIMKYVDREKIIEDNDTLLREISHQILACKGIDEEGKALPRYLLGINVGLKDREQKLEEVSNRINDAIMHQKDRLGWYEKNDTEKKDQRIQECKEELERLKKPETRQCIEEEKVQLKKEIDFYKNRIRFLENHKKS